MTRQSGTEPDERTERTRSLNREALARSDPFQLLIAEHELLRAQVRRTIRALRGLDEAAARQEAMRALHQMARQHMDREDHAVYPVCERLFGPYGAVSVMRTDHAAIEDGFQGLDMSALRGRRGEVAERVEGVAHRLDAHLAREERVLFPMMAALLSGTEMDRLARELRRTPTPRGNARR